MKTSEFLFKSTAFLLLFLFANSIHADEPKLPKSLDGMKFQSVEKFNVSDMPGRDVLEYRKLKFENRKFTLTYGNAILEGSYKWDSQTGQFETIGTLNDKRKFKGTYDPKTKFSSGTKTSSS